MLAGQFGQRPLALAQERTGLHWLRKTFDQLFGFGNIFISEQSMLLTGIVTKMKNLQIF